MSIFNPLGFLNNLVVQGRIDLQNAWRYNVGWDVKVQDISTKCKNCITKLKENQKKYQDVSQWPNRFSYIHFVTQVDQCMLQCANDSIVAPLKALIIPRLELQEASQIQQALEVKIDKSIFWIDFKIVSLWIRSEVRKLKKCVSKRVQHICWNTQNGQIANGCQLI